MVRTVEIWPFRVGPTVAERGLDSVDRSARNDISNCPTVSFEQVSKPRIIVKATEANIKTVGGYIFGNRLDRDVIDSCCRSDRHPINGGWYGLVGGEWHR